MPDLRRLRYFLAVADELNFSRAAQTLHVAQPALSRQVRLLEEELGVELLRRTTHEVALTEAGRFLQQRGPALIGAADELWRGTRSFGTGEQGSLILGFGTSAGYETAPRLIEAIRGLAPGLTISTRVLPLAEILDGVAKGSLDVGLARCPPDVAALDSRVLRLERQGVLLWRDHPLATLGWVPLVPDVFFELRLLARRYDRPPALERLLRAAIDAAGELGWLAPSSRAGAPRSADKTGG